MPAPVNTFKQRLGQGDALIGLWMALAHPTTAEICAGAGFDWLVIDAEHGPNTLSDIVAQLRVVQPRTTPVVRPRSDDRAWLKQLLDVGAQTLLVPMIESAGQAREVVRSVLYPPEGVRGVGASIARASNYGAEADYIATANDEICLLLQVESRAGLSELETIVAVDGVHGIFIGPADLAADMGHRGNPAHPEVRDAISGALATIRAAGKAAGILTSDRATAHAYIEAGIDFLAVGADVGVLRTGLNDLRGAF